MINKSINTSKLLILRKEKDFIFRWYTFHILKFWQFLKISNDSCVAFFSETPYIHRVSKIKVFLFEKSPKFYYKADLQISLFDK